MRKATQDKIPIAKCANPECGRTILYSKNPREKLNVTVRIAEPGYTGPTYRCAHCNTMLVVIEKPKVATGYVAIPEEWLDGDCYLLRTSGDSMIDIGIDDGDLVLIKRTQEAYDGQVVAVLTDEGTTLKRFMKRENGRPWLLAENKSYPKEKRELKPSKIEIQGIALKVIKDIK